jgi:hypothetical protein
VTGDGKGRFWISGHDPEHPGQAFLLRHDGRTTKALRGEKSIPTRTVRLQAVTHLPGTSTIWAVGHVVDATDRYTDIVETFAPKPTRPTVS